MARTKKTEQVPATTLILELWVQDEDGKLVLVRQTMNEEIWMAAMNAIVRGEL